MTTLIKIHYQLSHVMELRCCILFAHTNCSWSGCFIASFVLVKFSLCQDETPQENFLPIFVSQEAEDANFWWNQQVNQQVKCWIRSLAPDLSDHEEEWFKELKDTGPANEAEGQNTASASRTKLLENGRNSETSTAGESSRDVDVDLENSLFWL